MLYKFLSFLLAILSTSTLLSQHVWERTNPGGGGSVAMTGATADGTILAASDLSGVYKSSNNGLSWDVLGSTQGLTETGITCFGFHPTDGNTFIIGTAIGAFKTTDGGNTIYPANIEINPSLGLGYVESIAMDMTTGNVGYMAHHEDWEPELSFLKTTDGGDNWNILSTTGLPVDARITKIMVDHLSPDIVYVLTGKARFGCSLPNLYRSIDGGLSWTEIAVFADILDVDLHPMNSNTIYVSTFEANVCSSAMWQYNVGDENAGALFKSTDGGANFSQIGEETGIISVGDNPNHISITDIFYPSAWNEDAGTWSTLNGGASWTHTGFIENWFKGWAQIDSFIWSTSYNGLAKTITKDRFNPDRLYGAFGGWAWSSIDGGTTLNNISTTDLGDGQFLSTGMENIEGNCVEVNDANTDVAYIGGYDIGFWYSLNHGDSWKRSLPDNANYPDYTWYAGGGSNCNIVLSDPAREEVVWASFSADQPETKSALFRSDENGENWTMSNTGLDPFGLNTHGLSLDVNSPTDNRTLYITQNGNVFKSVDDGSSWSSILTVGGLKFTAVDQLNGQIVYAGGENGIWRSLDGGVNWINVGLPEMGYLPTVPGAIMTLDIVPTYSTPWVDPPIDAWQGIFEIKTDPNNEGRVFATAYGPGKGLYRSDDSGNSWTKIYTNDKMRGIAIAPNNSDVIYASSSLSYHSGGWDPTSIGIIVSTDGGTNWDFANEGMSWTNGGRMKIEPGGNPFIWAWSPGTGVQKSPVPYFIETPTINLNLKAFLQGPYNPAELKMSDELRTSNHIPFQEPYSALGYNPSEISNTSTSVLSISGDNAIVDWVLIQLRDADDPSLIIASKSALIQRDGDIVNPNGSSFTMNLEVGISSVYVSIIHRNHHGVRTLNTYSTDAAINIDYTSVITPIFGTDPLAVIGIKKLLLAGDANDDGQINSLDKNNYWRVQNSTPYFYPTSTADFNLDGYVNAVDRNWYWRPNNTKIEQLD